MPHEAGARNTEWRWLLAALLLIPGLARAQQTQSACDPHPYFQHIAQVLHDGQANAIQNPGGLFMRTNADGGDSSFKGVVDFGITPDGHTAGAKLEQSTGIGALDALMLGVARNASFGPFPACFPQKTIPARYPFVLNLD